MKKNLLSLLLLLLPLLSSAQDSLSYQVLGAFRAGKMYLRWAPASVRAWQLGRQQGYVLERYTLLAPGSSTPVADVRSTRVVLQPSLRPRPRAVFDSLALDSLSLSGQMAGVAGAALYEAGFQSTLGSSPLARAVNTTQDIENRYGMLLLACDASFAAAKAAALGWEDPTAQPGATYIYRMAPSQFSEPSQGATLRVQAIEDVGISAPPPSPSVLPGNRSVLLSWVQEPHYSGYVVECSADGGATYSARSKGLVLAIEQKDVSGRIYFTDSLANNTQRYLYRIRGQTPFGFLGAPSPGTVVQGEVPAPVAPPSILRLSEEGTAAAPQVRLLWRFPVASRPLIKGFRLYRSAEPAGPFRQLGADLSPSDSTFIDASPIIAGYYQVRAVSLNNEEVPSLGRLIQLKDETPPSVPSNLEGSMQKDGTVSLRWKNNSEADLLGYRVFYAQSASGPYQQLTGSPVSTANFSYQLPNKSIPDSTFFKVSALDQRENQSALSLALYIPLADAVPPSPAAIVMLDPLGRGIKITWEPSASKDVKTYEVQRRGGTQPDWQTILRKDSLIQGYRTTMDTLLQGSYEWTYRVLARDKSGLESYSPALSVKAPGAVRASIQNLQAERATLDNAYAAKLVWDYLDEPGVLSFAVYRQGDTGPQVLVATLFKDQMESIAGAAKGSQRYTWKDKQVKVGSTYQYFLQAKYFDGGASAMSPVVKVGF